MEEKSAQLPVSQQEVQMQAPSLLDKIKIHKFKILGGILGVFVFAGAVFGAYKLGQRQIQLVPSPTPTPDPTADWVVYQDIECGYSIKYPPLWFLNRASTCLSQFSDIKSDDPSETRVSVYTILSTREEVMERYNAEIGQKLKHGDIIEEKIANLTIGGEPAVRLTRTSLEGKLYSVFVLFAKDDRVFEIVNVVKNKTDQQRYNDTFNLMLSTFRFLEKEEEWKSYSNTELKFSLKYPEDWYVYNIDPSSILVTGLSHKPTHDEKYTGLLVHFRTDLTSGDLTESRRLIKWTVEGVKISGIDGFKAYPSSQAEIQSPETDWYFPNRDGMGTFEIQSVYYIGDKESNLKTFDQILSTFRFLE